MAAPSRETNDHLNADASSEPSAAASAAPIDTDAIILDETDEPAGPNPAPATLYIDPETPPDPMELTVDYQPNAEHDKPLTLTSILKLDNDSTSVSGVSLPPAAAVRHSVPGYEILRELGRGGMGVVYQARQKELNRLVALKMILAGSHAGGGERDRFRLEAEAVAALQHPNIVQIFEIGEAEGRPYLAFEFIEGGSLAQYLTGNPWPPLAAAALVETLARAVQFAHDRGIVHRDLKPGNILLAGIKKRKPESSGKFKATPSSTANVRLNASAIPDCSHPKITDFGLAKRVDTESDVSFASDEPRIVLDGQTRTGAVMGTPSYIAPEQAAGKNRDVGPAADIYALGAILYELLTGRPPFRGETPLDTVLQVMSDDPVAPRNLQPKLPRDLETICLRCLQKTPAKRYSSAAALADDLRRFLNHEPIEARPIGVRERAIKWAKRHPAAATSLFVSFLALATMLGISFWFNLELQRSAAAKANEASKAREAQRAAERSAQEEQSARKEEQKARKEEQKARKEEQKARKDAEREHEDRLDQARRAAFALALNRASALVDRDFYRAALLLDKKEECPPPLRDFTWYYLRALCRVEDGVLEGHTKTISHIAWSNNGSFLAASSWDGTARLWDSGTHRAIAVLRISQEPVNQELVRSIAVSPDNRTLVTIGDNQQINFWELPPALPRSANGEPPTLRPWASVKGGNEYAVAFSPDGVQVAAGAVEGKIRIFRVPTPQPVLMALGGGAASMISRTPQGGRSSEFGPMLPFSYKVTPGVVLAGHVGKVSALVWKKDGLYSSGEDREVRRWQPGKKTAGELVFKNNDAILSIDVSPNSDLLAVAGNSLDNNAIKIVNLRQEQNKLSETMPEPKVILLRGHIRPVNSVAFAPDGVLLASGSDDSTVRVWDAVTGQERSVLRGHKDPVRTVAFAPDQRELASGGLEHGVRLWKLAIPHNRSVDIDAAAPLVSASGSRDGRVLALADAGGSIKVWLRNGAGFSKAPNYVLKNAPGRIVTVAVDPRGGWVAAAINRQKSWSIVVWKLADAKGSAELEPHHVLKVGGEIYGLELNGPLLTAAGRLPLQVWNLEKKEPPRRFEAVSRAVAFTPDGTKLISASGPNIQAWDVSSGRKEGSMLAAHSGREIMGIAVGPSLEPGGRGWTVVTSDFTGVSWVWSLAAPSSPEGKLSGDALIFTDRATLTGHAEPVTSVSFSPDHKTLATSSDDRTIRLWDPVTGRERAVLSSHTDAVLFAAFLPEGSASLSVGREGTLKLWQAPR